VGSVGSVGSVGENYSSAKPLNHQTTKPLI
jgi:hypothetical protein